MSLGRGNGNANGNGHANGLGNGNSSKRVEPMPASYPPRPLAVRSPDPKTDQLQLGHITLEAVDRLTGMTADEIERVAERILDGAEETAGILGELARRVRENGVFANERLARFVRVANDCADMARSMQQNVEQREQLPPVPRKAEARTEPEPATAEGDGAGGLTAQPESKGVAGKADP